jgi:hypothetical protein
MKSQRGESLVGILVVLAIILVCVVVFTSGRFGVLGKSTRKDGLGVTTLGRARARALDTNCISNLNQIRMAIKIATDATEDEKPPQTLEELRLGDTILKCPIGKEPYKYDPATGEVHCQHPGHENL